MEAVPQMKKRSSLKMTSSFSQEQLEQLRNKYKRLSVNWDRSIDVKSLNLRHIKTVFEDDHDGLSKQQNEDKLQMKIMFDNKRRSSVKNEFNLVREYLRSHDISEEEDDDDNARKIKENTLKNIEFGKQRDELFDNNNDSSFSNSDDDNDNDNIIKINK